MKKLNGYKADIGIANTAGPPRKPAPGKTVPPAANKGPVSTIPQKDAPPPLRAAKGDDDLMSEEPPVRERG